MCIELDELKEFPVRGCQSISVCCSDAALEARLTEAIDMVEHITGQWVCPREVCFTTKGNKSKQLYFIPYVSAPATEIESITRAGTVLDIEYTLNDHFIKSQTYCFDCCDYTVCGTFGYATIPPMLKRAIIVLALEFAYPGVTGYAKPFGMSRADWADFSISYRLEDDAQKLGVSTGIKEVDIWLQPFINYSAMFTAISPCPDGCCDTCSDSTTC
jgi:hypothetical protein